LAWTRGQQHAVLVVRTTAGDLVLDNLRNAIVGWDETGYRYEKIQSPAKEWIWLSL
jgi:predicted transglutaminase-like cysteine proteinase